MSPTEHPRLIGRKDPEYPPELLEAAANDEFPEPELLRVRGRRLDTLTPRVAIVGARNPTAYGREVARGLARDLAVKGVCVVSGMARGIDSEAHRGALDAGGTTVAVLAAGVARPYPPGGEALFRRILERGAVVSERPDGRNYPKLFPERNRIIAGMSLAVVVVQGRYVSGTKSTVDWAGKAHRDVLAVPGDVRSDLSAFPHELIRSGAGLCRCAEDVLEGIGLSQRRTGIPLDAPLPEGLEDAERAMLSVLGAEPCSLETAVVRSGLDVVVATRALTRLELAGLAGRGVEGSYYRAR